MRMTKIRINALVAILTLAVLALACMGVAVFVDGAAEFGHGARRQPAAAAAADPPPDKPAPPQ